MKRKDKHCRRDPEHGRQLLNHRDHLLGAYLLNAGAATRKFFFPMPSLSKTLPLTVAGRCWTFREFDAH
jgi:hypothetical protein